WYRGGNLEKFYLEVVAYKYSFFVFRLCSVGDRICALMKELYLDISTLISSFRWSVDIGDVGNVDSRRSIEHSDIERGSKVLVEYTPVSYPGKRAKEVEPGFNP